MRRRRRALGAVLALMLAPLLYAVLSHAARPADPRPWLAPAKPGTTCILPGQRMRTQHMTYLRALRDQVVREGRRAPAAGGRPSGITACRDCHAEREPFCDRCHARASVRLDCFGCHDY
jgi:hypothetical protein